MSILPKEILRLMLFPSKLHIFTKIGKEIIKSIWNHKRPRIPKMVLRKKNRAGWITSLDFKIYYRARTNKIVWYWNKHRHRKK